MTEIDEQLQEICDFLNEYYCEYKPTYIESYGEHIAISFWECGAIVCIEDLLFFIEEDDGTWTIHGGMLSSFNIGWTNSFVKALTGLQEYVKENGRPVYYVGSDIISNYTL